jgi:hypothetical protein
MEDTEYCPNFIFISFCIGAHLTNHLSVIFTEENEENTNEPIASKNISS